MKTKPKTAPSAPASKPARKTAAKKAPAKKAASPRAPAKKTAARKPRPAEPLKPLAEKIRAALEGKKGENVVALRVAEVSSVADCLVLCTGLNAPHLRALADQVVRRLRLETPPLAPHRRAGSTESEWLVLDYVDVVVHLFTPSMRAYYALEQLWKDPPVL